jgi:alpha-L-arabinofuranosidase
MNRIVINADMGSATISRHIYGHFAEHLGRCIYGGFWVGQDSAIPNTRGIRDDIVAALRAIKIPNLRWPGGCFADEYHWMDGIGPRAQRPTMINTHWGGVTENNHFGTHEFLDLCEQLGCEPYICGNVGSGTIQEMQQWVEYLTFDGVSPMADLRRRNGREQPWPVRFWGVGNENWGCGGNMSAEYYADEYRRYQTYVRNFGENEIFKIACGPRNDDYGWTDVLMRRARNGRGRLLMHGLSLHYYTPDAPRRLAHRATEFGEEGWFEILTAARVMEELVSRHGAIMDRYDPERQVGLIVDEWGTWFAAEPGTNPRFLYQQNSMRDALVAALTLHIFNAHCERVTMANIAQTVNVLQALILTDPDSERMVLTPTYHVFDMFKAHHDATLLPLDLSCDDYTYGDQRMPGLSTSASRDQAGRVHLTLCHANPHTTADVLVEVRGMQLLAVEGRVLTAEQMTAHNTFDAADQVRPRQLPGVAVQDNRLTLAVPPMAVVALELRGETAEQPQP